MKKWIRILSLVLSLILCLALFGCGENSGMDTTKDTTRDTNPDTNTDTNTDVQYQWELTGMQYFEGAPRGEMKQLSLDVAFEQEKITPYGQFTTSSFSLSLQTLGYTLPENALCVAYLLTSENMPDCFKLTCIGNKISDGLATPLVLLICPEEEWMILELQDQKGVYYVGSTKANADLQQILTDYLPVFNKTR